MYFRTLGSHVYVWYASPLACGRQYTTAPFTPPFPDEIMIRASAFADDLVAYLANAAQLPIFKNILHIYERGSGALNSWGAKTLGLRIGASSDPDADPFPPDWDPDLVNFDAPTIRTLGVFLGTSPRVAAEWHKRITKRISERFNTWRTTRMPTTIYGKSIAIKNSVLAIAWFLVNHAAPPENSLDGLLSKWQEGLPLP